MWASDEAGAGASSRRMTRTTTRTTTTRWMWRRESSDERVRCASMPSFVGGGRPTIPSYRSTSSPSALRLSENGHPSEISASSFELASHSRGATPRVCAARHRRHVMAGDDSDSDDILMSEDATNWMSVGKGVNPLAEIARITGRTPRTEDRKRNATNTPANTESTIPARPAFTPCGGGIGGVGGVVGRADPADPADPRRQRRGQQQSRGGCRQ